GATRRFIPHRRFAGCGGLCYRALQSEPCDLGNGQCRFPQRRQGLSGRTGGRCVSPAGLKSPPKRAIGKNSRGFKTMLNRRNGYEYEDLLACGRGELFGPGNAQLPLPPMLMFDRITEISETGGEYGKGLVRAELNVNPDLWFFGCHFKGDPVMPGCLGLDALWQMVGFYLGWVGGEGRGRALGLGDLKFSGQVMPNVRKIVYNVDIKRV